MSLDEESLQQVAQNGDMDYDRWPSIIEPLLDRINHIAYNEFPTPRPYSNISRSQLPSSPIRTQSNSAADQTQTTSSISQTPSTPIRNLPPVPPFPNSETTPTSHIPDSLPPSQNRSSDPLTELPILLLQLLNGVTTALRIAFSEKPPHTIQRLAELVLQPTKHYKTLPAWLRAVDRVVSVSSSADIFPLSDAPPLLNGVNETTVGGILWTSSSSSNTRSGYDSAGLGSDESLGGALLTPIPWLRNGVSHTGDDDDSTDMTQGVGPDDEDDDGLGGPIELPSTAGHSAYGGDPLVPEREGGAVTQGELIRMEQEAGVVPVSQSEQSTSRTMAGSEGMIELDEEGEPIPHARGPDLIDAVDMGKVDGRNVQVHLDSPLGEDAVEVGLEDASHVDGASESDGRGVKESDSGLDTEPFEMVGKSDVEEDEMQIDTDEAITQSNKDDEPLEDSDIVLVDADGKMDGEDGNKADASGENVGPDAADSSTVT